MKLNVFRNLWGISNKTYKWKDILPLLNNIGYDGVEVSVSDIKHYGGISKYEEAQNILESKMKMICGVYSGWIDYVGVWSEGDRSVEDHIKSFENELEQALRFNPFHINCHSGSDHWDFEQAKLFFEKAIQIQNKPHFKHLSISHETHRGRVLSNPWITLKLIQLFPELRLTLDFSHWCITSERLLDTEFDEKWLEKIIERVDHIHARIGTPQSPQVTDPSDPHEFTKIARNRFDKLWSDIWKFQYKNKECGFKSNNEFISTLTPEYGPIPYTPSLPLTGAPISDVFMVCNNEMVRQRKRFEDTIENLKRNL